MDKEKNFTIEPTKEICQGLDKSNLVRSITNQSKIMKKKVGRNEHSVNYLDNSINSKCMEHRSVHCMKMISIAEPNQQNCLEEMNIIKENTIKDISNIVPMDKFVIQDSIENSIFGGEEADWEKKSQENENNEHVSSNLSHLSSMEDMSSKRLGDVLIEKIANANYNEEIILPDCPIVIKLMVIFKPVRLTGQTCSLLEVTEGPIAINISDNYDNEIVKFSQMKIVFNLFNNECIKNQNVKQANPSNLTFLFKLYPGAMLEIEDCDISARDKKINDSISSGIKNKIVCFVMNSKSRGKREEVEQEVQNNMTNQINPSILTMTSSRVYNFYQTVRAGENCIINMEKCNIKQNLGKSIVIINPLIMKIIETTFERNNDNAIHIKFLKDDFLKSNRKFFFRGNIFEFNLGNGICIEGIENYAIDLDLLINDNTFHYNKSDSVIMWDLSYNTMEISNNNFVNNKGNGLNIQKVVPRALKSEEKSEMNTSASAVVLLCIKGNNFIENGGFGIFLNDCRAMISGNNFNLNKASGMILCSLILDNPGLGLNVLKTQSSVNTNSLSTEGSNKMSLTGGIPDHSSTLVQNLFWKNGESGVKIINYNYTVLVCECIFRENCEHGIFIDLDANVNNSNISPNSTFLEKIKQFKSCADSTQMPIFTNLYVKKTTIEKNLKSGLAFSNCFVFSDSNVISDNLGFAIYTPKEEFRHCFKESKTKSKNIISGSIGGEWGEISLGNKTACSGCFSGNKDKRIEQRRETQPQVQVQVTTVNNPLMSNNNNIIQNRSNSMKSNSNNDNHSKCRIV